MPDTTASDTSIAMRYATISAAPGRPMCSTGPSRSACTRHKSLACVCKLSCRRHNHRCTAMPKPRLIAIASAKPGRPSACTALGASTRSSKGPAPRKTTIAAPMPSQVLAPSAARATWCAPETCPAPRFCVITTLTPMLITRNSRKNAPSTWLDKANAADAVSDSREASHRPSRPTPKPSTSSAIKGQASITSRGRGSKVVVACLFKGIDHPEPVADRVHPLDDLQGIDVRHDLALDLAARDAVDRLEYLSLESIDGERAFLADHLAILRLQSRARRFPESRRHGDDAGVAEHTQAVFAGAVEAAHHLRNHIVGKF